MRLWLGLLLLCALPAVAQKRPAKKVSPPPAQASAHVWPIEKMTVQGNRNFTEAQVLGITGLKIGQVVAKADFDAAQNRLAASGVFDSVDFKFGPAPDGKGYIVTFEVVEAGPLFPMRFEDLNAPEAELRAALQRADPLFAPKMPATKPALEKYVKILENYLAAHGRTEKLSGGLQPGDDGQMAVVFRPAAQPPVIASVKFVDSKALAASALQNRMNSIAVGLPFREPRFRLLLDANVRPMYEARGRLRVQFTEIRTEPAKNVKGLDVTVKVIEGDSYSIGQVAIDGPGFARGALDKAADLKPGDLADFDQVHQAAARVETQYRHEGYMKVATRIDRKIDDAKKTVDITIRAEPGPQYMFGKLQIEGLDLNAEAAVRKLWSLQPGKRFNSDYPNYFLDQLREGGYFDNLGKTRAVLDTNDETKIVDVKLVFTGAPPPKPEPKW